MVRFRKRKRSTSGKTQKSDETTRRERNQPYEEIKRENSAFSNYYHEQRICSSDDDWLQFSTAICKNLPTTFRITGFRDGTETLLNIIRTELFDEYINAFAEINNLPKELVEKPICLPWYPEKMAYQFQLTRKDIRRSESLFRLHNFLIVETNAGCISRQEAVSMIPPIVLNVKPTDKVLDMCAAPGSKTAQLIEALHSCPEKYKTPPGFVVANDVDNNRCYMLVHQTKRLNSPCFVVTNHDSSFLPNLMKTDENGATSILKFDKILCDVPCSGDGTLRKNPDIWSKWNLGQAYNLHGIQYRILRRGSELLEVGGRLVYSTCSLNPIENEAVLQRIINDAEGALEIVDPHELVPNLKYNPGMTHWKLASKDVGEFYTTFDEVPEDMHTIIRPNMFPLPNDKIEKIGLEKCIRVLPHLQDTGGFFVAVIEKKKELPFEKKIITETNLEKNCTLQRKRRRLHGFKEDPYIFLKERDSDWDEIKNFYEMDDSFNHRSLLTRCAADRKKNIYFCSEAIRDFVCLNNGVIKIVNTGVKTFVRCENRHTIHPFRLAQEGLPSINAFMGANRRIDVTKDDLILLLNCTDPTKPPSTQLLQAETQNECKRLEVGSCILKYTDISFTLCVVGWRGTSSLRAYVDTNDTIHILRLLGADLSNFEVNKYKKQ